jgi:4-hydroxy-tetrahydrodipicolinate reductase
MANRTLTRVMVNGLSADPKKGKMARAVAELIVGMPDRYRLYNFALTGDSSNEAAQSVNIRGVKVDLYTPNQKVYFVADSGFDGQDGIVVDFTRPGALLENARFYADAGWSFVMGTTGRAEDLDAARKVVLESPRWELEPINAIIAPNMSWQIATFQGVIEGLAERFPGGLEGCTLRIRESHQSTKEDTSGTAKAIVSAFRKLGVKFEVSDITKIRAPAEQLAIGVDERNLKWHAFHEYELSGSVMNTVLATFEIHMHTLLYSNPAFGEYGKQVSDASVKDKYVLSRTSPNKDVFFEATYARNGEGQDWEYEKHTRKTTVRHNVNGGDTYAQGAVWAVGALLRLNANPERGKVLSMVDAIRL